MTKGIGRRCCRAHSACMRRAQFLDINSVFAFICSFIRSIAVKVRETLVHLWVEGSK